MMILESSSLRIDVLTAFQGLQQAFDGLSEHLLQEINHPIWLQEDPLLADLSETRALAVSQIGRFDYLPLQEPRETLLCIGLIGSSPQTLEAALLFNQAKHTFKASILALRASKIDTHEALKQMGFGRLHLKQCYRTLPLLHKIPTKVRWTWANTRAIQRITVETAVTLLHKRGNDYGIQQQIERCASLPAGTPLAIVQELAPHVRANLVFGDKETGYERHMIKAPLPILFPADAHSTLPDYKPCKAKASKNENRIIRMDTKLDPIPFLPAIRAHRYW